jgi:Tol biopolymer transport system component/predicted Ser/Thr protein kinase
MIGQTISHYKILEKLGEGGMGVVYKAEDTKLKRTVALKFLPRGLEAHEPERARFLQEAQAAAALNHPNICTIHDIALESDQQFIVMEYVDGKTMRERVPIQKVQDAINYAIQIGEALEEAHSKGVVHRDVKTDNIMVTAKNQVKVMDFGLAKLKGSLKLTKTSSTVGTLAYMAPEQIQGGEVDARSDIFSFGVVLYEMLTGQLPFRGEHEAAMVYSIVNEEPESIQKYRPDLSSEFLHIMNRALEKDPEDRYQSVHDMVIDLRRGKKETSRVSRGPLTAAALPQPGTEVPEGQKEIPIAAKKRPKVIRWIGLSGVVVLLAAAVIFFLLPKHVPKLNPNPAIRTLEVPFTEINYPSLSRDGGWVAFAARDANREWSIYFMNVAKGNPRRLTAEPFQTAGYAEISPDNSEVVYGRIPPGGKPGIYVVSSNGGTGRKLAEPGDACRWRPDGNLIGYILGGIALFGSPSQSGKREFWTVRPDGSDRRLEFVDSLGYLWGSTLCFDWSPDGKSIAWLRSFPKYGEIFIRNLETGKERQLTSHTKEIDEIAWATNNQIFFSSNKGGNTNTWMIAANGGEAVQVTRGSGPDLGVRVSADAKRLLFMEQRSISHVWTADLDGSNARELTFDNQSLNMPQFSPDKSQISFDMSSSDVLRPGSHVYVMKSDGTNRTQLTAGDAPHYNATWSPDGKYLTYGSNRLEQPFDSAQVFLVEASNPATPRPVGRGFGAWWISTDKFVTMTLPPQGHTTLYSVHTNEPIQVGEDSAWQFPVGDGNQVLLMDFRIGREGWWLKSAGEAPGATQKQILSSEYLYDAWPSVSFRYLLYREKNGELWRIRIPEGKRERLPDIFKGQNPGRANIQMSYDDKQVIFLRGRLDARLVLIENVFE